MNSEKQSTNLQMTLREVNRVGEGKKNIPKLRFKGYEDAWEQRKLGEVGTTYTGLSGKTKEDFGHGNGQFITYMNVFSNAVASSEMVEPVEIDDRQNKVVAGDVLFTTSSETPEEVGMSSVWLENSKNTYLNSFCFGYRPIIPFDPYYLAFMLRSSLMRKKITFLAQGISRYNISKNKMMDIEIPVPIMSEQHQIGEYFRNLDYLITLHQRKYDALKTMKKTLLSKMFPKDGEDVPEIRFKGFTDAWEQRKLGDIAESTYGGGTPKTTVEEFWNGEIPWIQSSDIQEDQVFNVQVRKTITEKGLANSAAKLIPKNSIAIVTRVGVGKLGLIPFDFTTSQDFLSLSSLNIDSNFALYLLFKRLQFESKMAQGTSIKGITKEELLSKEVKIAHIDMEQKSIGYFFQNLDDIITLHQRRSSRIIK